MRYYTPKLSLTAPSIDDEVSALRENWARLDEAYAGSIVVNPGVVPDDSVLYDGCIVAERTTGIVWRAQRNVTGAFEKKYIRYPWSVSIAQGINNCPNQAAVWKPWGYDTYESGWNSSAADLVNYRVVIPFTGFYVGRDMVTWKSTPSAHYAHTLWRNDNNGTAPTYNDWYESTWPYAADGGDLVTVVSINEKLYKGDTILAGIWQDAAGPVGNFHRIQLSLLRLLD